MTIHCVWEHNGKDTLLYAVDFVGAYTRGETLEAAVRKMQAEICSYLKWCGKKAVTSMDVAIIEEKGMAQNSDTGFLVRIGHCVKSCAVLSGMTAFTPRQCIEWLQKFLVRRALKIRFTFLRTEF